MESRSRVASANIFFILFAAVFLIIVVCWLFLGDIYSSMGETSLKALDLVSARKNLSFARRIYDIQGSDSKYYEVSFQLSELYIEQKDYDSANEILAELITRLKIQRKGTETDRMLVNAYTTRGYVNFLRSNPELGESSLASALKIDPQNPKALYVSALIRLNSHQPREALELFSRAIEQTQKRKEMGISDYYLGKAQAHYELREYENALIDLENIEKEQSAFASYDLRISVLSKMGKFRKAQEVCVEAISRFPSARLLLFKKASIDMLLGEFALAEQELLQLVGESGSLRQEIFFSLGISYLCQSKIEQAITYLKASIELNPELVTVLLFLASHDARRGSTELFSELDKRTTNFNNPRILVYQIILQGKLSWGQLEDLLEFKRNAKNVIKKIEKLLEGRMEGFEHTPDETQWDEVAFVCGVHAYCSGESGAAVKFFQKTMKEKSYFYPTYIIASHLVRSIKAQGNE